MELVLLGRCVTCSACLDLCLMVCYCSYWVSVNANGEFQLVSVWYGNRKAINKFGRLRSHLKNIYIQSGLEIFKPGDNYYKFYQVFQF